MFVSEHGLSKVMIDSPRGLQGVRHNVGHLRRLILKGSQSLMVRRAAEEAIRDVPAKAYVRELHAIHDWVDNYVRFTRDPQGTERFVEPDQILGAIFTDGGAFLDCDDYSILLGSMLKSVGFPVRLNVVGKGSHPHHVFVSALAGNRWYALDPQTSRHPVWRFRENTYV